MPQMRTIASAGATGRSYQRSSGREDMEWLHDSVRAMDGQRNLACSSYGCDARAGTRSCGRNPPLRRNRKEACQAAC